VVGWNTRCGAHSNVRAQFVKRARGEREGIEIGSRSRCSAAVGMDVRSIVRGRVGGRPVGEGEGEGEGEEGEEGVANSGDVSVATVILCVGVGLVWKKKVYAPVPRSRSDLFLSLSLSLSLRQTRLTRMCGCGQERNE
jgi:hypothetical protein